MIEIITNLNTNLVIVGCTLILLIAGFILFLIWGSTQAKVESGIAGDFDRIFYKLDKIEKKLR